MRRLLACDCGATAAEYALILAVLGLAVGASSLQLAIAVDESIRTTADKVGEAAGH